MNNPYNSPPGPGQQNHGHPQQGHPQHGHPQQGHPQQGHPQQGHPQHGHPQHGHPQQGHPQQGFGQPPFGQPPFGQPPFGQPGFSQPQYEFSAVEEQTIGRTATWAKAVAILFFVQAAFSLIGFNIVAFGIDLVIGLSVLKGSKALSAAATTQGNDISHMMEAMSQLSTAFMIRLVLVGIVLGICLLAVVAGLIIALAMQ